MSRVYAYEVWDHGHLYADDSTAIAELEFSLGYYILEFGEPGKLTGALWWSTPFAWERRSGPLLSQPDAYREQSRPRRTIGFGDFERLRFVRDAHELAKIEYIRDRERGLIRPNFKGVRPLGERIDALVAVAAECLSNESWSLKYRVTGEYCDSQGGWRTRIMRRLSRQR